MCGSGKKAARKVAAATLKAAEMQAANDRLQAQGALQTLSTQIAQKRASEQAAESLSRPQQQIDVTLATDTPAPELDPTTGRRKTVRSTFQSRTNGAGISI